MIALNSLFPWDKIIQESDFQMDLCPLTFFLLDSLNQLLDSLRQTALLGLQLHTSVLAENIGGAWEKFHKSYQFTRTFSRS